MKTSIQKANTYIRLSKVLEYSLYVITFVVMFIKGVGINYSYLLSAILAACTTFVVYCVFTRLRHDRVSVQTRLDDLKKKDL